jgi:glycosyltransferase involved in cell wall biosynthesis
MRLNIDCRCLVEGEQGGIAQYARQLIPKLVSVLQPEVARGFVTGRKAKIPNLDSLNLDSKIIRVNLPNKLLNLSLACFQRPRLNHWLDPNSVIFAPTPKYFALDAKLPLVLTVHDLSFVEHPEFFTTRQRFWHAGLRIRSLLKRATRIIAVSQYTKADIIRLAPETAEKIKVIYSGVDHIPQTTFEPLRDLPKQYLLCFAPAEARKNILNLVAAFKEIYLKYKIPLVLVGTSQIPDSPGLIRLPYLSEKDRWRVMTHAFALIYPSVYEGFGFPPLEAMALGVPVISSQVTSIPEVCAEAALLVDPWDPADLRRAISSIYEEKNLREKLIQLGRTRAAEFKWQGSAEQTAKVIQEAYADRH